MALKITNLETGEVTIKYEGAVFQSYSRDVQIMSDVWDTASFVVFWNEEKQRVDHISYDYSMTVDKNKYEVTIDYTEENLQKAIDSKVPFLYENLYLDEKNRIQEIAKGDVVTVVKGKNGTNAAGIVVAEMYAEYRMGWKSKSEKKLGIALDNETVLVEKNGKTYTNYKNMIWAWKRNCEKVTVEVPDVADLLERARENARSEVLKGRR